MIIYDLIAKQKMKKMFWIPVLDQSDTRNINLKWYYLTNYYKYYKFNYKLRLLNFLKNILKLYYHCVFQCFLYHNENTPKSMSDMSTTFTERNDVLASSDLQILLRNSMNFLNLFEYYNDFIFSNQSPKQANVYCLIVRYSRILMLLL